MKTIKGEGRGVSRRCGSMSTGLALASLALVVAQVTTSSQTSSGFKASDPGVRAGAAGAGAAIAGLTRGKPKLSQSDKTNSPKATRSPRGWARA